MALGEVSSFPHKATVHLKPHLWRQQRQSSSLPSLPSWALWSLAVSLALYPLWVILLEKYRADFQSEWQEQVQSMQGTLGLALRVVLSCMDAWSNWIVVVCPRIASSILMIHLAFCLTYVLSFMIAHDLTNHRSWFKIYRMGILTKSISDRTWPRGQPYLRCGSSIRKVASYFSETKRKK